VSRFDHVGLSVADLDAAVALEGVMLIHESGWRFELLSRGGARPGIAATNLAEAALTLGYGHFALEVSSARSAYDDLLAAGATDAMSPRPSPDPRACRRCSSPTRGGT